ncbi:hypothetical protein V9T40_012225 [Parthenolecanium corni]|uniref:Vacuolar protein sorting-associated protein 11 homolog n=1 Tax=Parthenolecanium corni TaxID=536013 RepID=A0AAN9TAB4_9HEMI
MSFLEWRRFNFFDLKNNVDSGSISTALGGTNITATSCGHGTIVICDSEGVIHLVNRNFNVTTFQGYLITVSLVEQLKSLPVLVAIGEDVSGDSPLIKIWDLEKRDRQGNPISLRTLSTSPANQVIPASSLAISDSSNLMAVGFANGAIILYRGKITKDRVLKETLLRSQSDPVTGLAFKTSGQYSYLFVATTDSILQYNVTVKNKEFEISLDTSGCDIGCSVLADSVLDCPFMVAREDAIYCYSTDGRGPCYAVEGRKICLQWFRSYLIIVSRDKTSDSLVTVLPTDTEERASRSGENESNIITVLDIQNKFIVFSTVINDVIAVLPEWGSFYILTKDRNLHNFREKDLQSKLNVLFKKNLYHISIRIAKNQQYDSDSLIDIFRQYGDHLYAKGDHSEAIDQYIKTIGKLEPSYVIRKFLDAQYIDSLIKYLSALHEKGVATGDHTTLLLNCYIKLNQFQKLKDFILNKNRDIDFDLNVAINVCRKSSSDDALILAEKHNLHLWYIKILLEDKKEYLFALQHLGKLEFTEAYDMVMKFGDIFVQNIPDEFTNFLKKLCTNYQPCDKLLVDQDNDKDGHQADPRDFFHLLLNNSAKMVEFLEYLTEFSHKWNTSVYNTLIEHYLQLWHESKDITVSLQYEQKIMNTLQSTEICYDKNQALILCSARNFKPGLLHLLEENKLYKQILRYQLSCGNYQDVIACCRRFGYLEPSLWIKALWAASSDPAFPSNILREILTVIAKEKLLSPLQVVEIVSRSKTLKVDDISDYLIKVLEEESKVIDSEKRLIEKHKNETKLMREHLHKVKHGPILFQGANCNACRDPLDLPTVYFMCKHSFHEYCYQSFSEENQCPSCLPDNKKISGVLDSQEKNINDIHESFHSGLEKTQDSFSLIADYFGRNIFKFEQPPLKPKIMVNLAKDYKKTAAPAINSMKIRNEIRNMDDFGSSSLEAHISRARVSPVNVMTEESLTSVIQNKSNNIVGANPFEEYDDDKNPFSDEVPDSEDDDYDRSLNPFAS